MSRRAALAILLVGTLVNLGCDKEVHRARTASLTLADSLSQSHVPDDLPEKEGRMVRSPRLYIDASLSMQGYVNEDEETPLGRTIEQLTMALGVDSIFRFGAGAGPLAQPVVLGREVHRPRFFTLSHNPDHELFRWIAADTVGTAFVYVTDGVLSAPQGETPASVLVPVKEYLASGGSLTVLAFRGPFRGRGWSEQRQRWVHGVNVEDRPFYAFVFAPSPWAMTALLELLDHVSEGAVIIRFDSALLRCRVSWTGLAVFTYEELANDSQWLMLTPSHLSFLRGERESVLAHYDCSSASFAVFPVVSVVPEVEVRYAQAIPGGGSFESLGTTFNKRPVSELFPVRESDNVTSTILAAFEDDPATRFGFFELRFRNRSGPLRQEVLALGAESDTHPDDFGATYRLVDLIRELARSEVARSRPAAPLYLTTQYH